MVTRTKKWVVLVLIASFLGSAIAPVRAVSANEPKKLSDQITADLLGAGISVGAALSGSVPLALMAGFLTKYISTYGIAGVKSLIELFKGYAPQDLGEINLYYVYLIHVKRNLYGTLIQIRKSVENDDNMKHLEEEIKKAEAALTEACDVSKGCVPTQIDQSLINFSLLNILLDAKQSVDVSRYLQQNEVKATYQYLILLYLDVIIIEQKLIEAQYNVMANRSVQTLQLLKDNPYISQAEKEMQAQLVYNMALRWMMLADTRRVIVAQAIKNPLINISNENDELEGQIDGYLKRGAKKKAGSHVLD
jgi:hypothetical protein